MATAEFTFNNKIHTAIKSSLFKTNYGWKLRISFEIRKKKKYTKTEKLVKEMKKIHKKVKVVLKKLQKEIKKYMDKNRKEAVKYRMGDKMLLSIKDLMWQMRNMETKKLTEKLLELYKIKKIIS